MGQWKSDIAAVSVLVPVSVSVPQPEQSVRANFSESLWPITILAVRPHQNRGGWKCALTERWAVSLLCIVTQSVNEIVMLPMNPYQPCVTLVNLEKMVVFSRLATQWLPQGRSDVRYSRP